VQRYVVAINMSFHPFLCSQGLRGKNTEVLTYSGALAKSVKAAKRRAAGCTDRYCAKLIEAALKKDPTNTAIKRLNSCDEVGQPQSLSLLCVPAEKKNLSLCSIHQRAVTKAAVHVQHSSGYLIVCQVNKTHGKEGNFNQRGWAYEG